MEVGAELPVAEEVGDNCSVEGVVEVVTSVGSGEGGIGAISSSSPLNSSSTKMLSESLSICVLARLGLVPGLASLKVTSKSQ